MKKIIMLLLAFVLMISMCACGSKELSAEEKERIYQEVAAEKVKAENGDRVTYTRNWDNNGLAEELPEPLGDKNFVVEACKTEICEYDHFTHMDIYVKIRNLTEYSPPYCIAFYSTIIDENGDALCETFHLGSTDIAPPGTAQWLRVIGDMDGAAGIRIMGYQVFVKGVVLEQYFDKPIDLYCKDYKVSYEAIKDTDY